MGNPVRRGGLCGSPHSGSRRQFLTSCGGIGIGALAAGNNPCSGGSFWFGTDAWGKVPADQEAAYWLRGTGTAYRGSVVRMVTENTAPSAVIAALAKEEFTPETGIEVAIELLPLERVLQKIGMDITHGAALYDLYYLDQSWIARFADHTEDPRPFSPRPGCSTWGIQA